MTKSIGFLLLIIFSVILSSCVSLSEVQDQNALTPEEIRTLFENKTYVLISMKSGKELLVYSAHDQCTMRYVTGTRLKTQQWYIKGNQHCCVNKAKEMCGEIFPKANGVYHKIDKGRLTHIMKDFREGNQL